MDMVAKRLRPASRARRSTGRRAIIDIGSNSVRLVVYDGPARIPYTIFNEKVMAGLGRGLADTGRIDEESMERGLRALARFRRLTEAMDIADVDCVATAAVRDAENGGEFVARAEALGLSLRLLSGEEEGHAAGYGVLSAIPDADGIVGDLGGGSLELVRVRKGEVERAISLPLGVLRIEALRAKGKSSLESRVRALLRKHGWSDIPSGLPFYMVGGSWRALARVDMYANHFALPIIHHYTMPADRAAKLVRIVAGLDKARLRGISSLSSARIPTLGNAAAVLSVIVKVLGSRELVVSAFGLREGLLFQKLGPAERTRDPLLEAAAAEGERQGRFAEHGELIDDWIAPIFAADPPEWQRLRRAACLLADTAWRANPEFRAERGAEIALHGNWIGVDVCGRAMLAQALSSSFGGGLMPELQELAMAEALGVAAAWGTAIRLAQRLSGGVAGPLEVTRLDRRNGNLSLVLKQGDMALAGETVERRLKQLGSALGLETDLRTA